MHGPTAGECYSSFTVSLRTLKHCIFSRTSGLASASILCVCVCVYVCVCYGNMKITFTALDTTWTRPCPSASMYKPVWPARPNFSLRLIVTEVGSSTETVWIEGIHWCMHTCVHVLDRWMGDSPSKTRHIIINTA